MNLSTIQHVILTTHINKTQKHYVFMMSAKGITIGSSHIIGMGTIGKKIETRNIKKFLFMFTHALARELLGSTISPGLVPGSLIMHGRKIDPDIKHLRMHQILHFSHKQDTCPCIVASGTSEINA